jgi:hypothetical protein
MGEQEVDQVRAEFHGVMNDIAGTYVMATMGVLRYADELGAQIMNTPNPDADMMFGLGDPNDADALTYQRWPKKTLLGRLARDGQVWRDLGQQWIVAIASWWNDHYRQQFADALDSDRGQDGTLRDTHLVQARRHDSRHARARGRVHEAPRTRGTSRLSPGPKGVGFAHSNRPLAAGIVALISERLDS